MGDHILELSKATIEYLARGVEFAAALIIGIAALEATVKSLVLFVRPTAPAEAKKLAAIATLRTALNYFLEREINQESKPSQIQAEQTVVGPSADPLQFHSHNTVPAGTHARD